MEYLKKVSAEIKLILPPSSNIVFFGSTFIGEIYSIFNVLHAAEWFRYHPKTAITTLFISIGLQILSFSLL